MNKRVGDGLVMLDKPRGLSHGGGNAQETGQRWARARWRSASGFERAGEGAPRDPANSMRLRSHELKRKKIPPQFGKRSQRGKDKRIHRRTDSGIRFAEPLRKLCPMPAAVALSRSVISI
jgi:hypothetical protein